MIFRSKTSTTTFVKYVFCLVLLSWPKFKVLSDANK
jgi:hypothetical protein